VSIRWGILGCGAVCEVKSGPALQRAVGSELVAVMRRSADKAADYARRHNVPRWTDDADALIRDADVDAVYVATPPGSHCHYALRVCAAGKPAYVEKPMARNHSECRRMVDAFAAADLPLFVAYYRRGLPRFRKVRDLLAAGAIGRVTGVSCRLRRPVFRPEGPAPPWRLIPAQSGGGLFVDLGSHTLDILDFLLGPLQDVAGTAANVASPYEVEDRVVMHFRTPAGAAGVGSWNFAAAEPEDRIEIDGADGQIALSTFGQEPVALRTAAGQEHFDLPNPPHIQQPLIQMVVDALEGRGACPSTGTSAARTSRVMDTVLRDYYGSRRDGFWERPAAWPGRRQAAGIRQPERSQAAGSE